MNTAQIILKQKIWKIQEVAQLVGFNSVSYFSQCFKKYTGKTPQAFMSDF
jgi:YesN/AraC family two-component response regulator